MAKIMATLSAATPCTVAVSALAAALAGVSVVIVCTALVVAGLSALAQIVQRG